MDLNTLRELIQPFIELTLAVVVSGIGVAGLTQVLKDYRIPIPAEKYPRATAAGLSILATLISLYTLDMNLLLDSAWEYIGLGLSILVASGFSYNMLFKGLNQKNIEPEGE